MTDIFGEIMEQLQFFLANHDNLQFFGYLQKKILDNVGM